jgi:S-adenosylmethionine/arginine decarboxylase-like enzyme
MYVLSESHMSIHTFPEVTRVAIDLYCCRSGFEEEMDEIRRFFIREFDGIVIRSMVITRPISIIS